MLNPPLGFLSSEVFPSWLPTVASRRCHPLLPLQVITLHPTTLVDTLQKKRLTFAPSRRIRFQPRFALSHHLASTLHAYALVASADLDLHTTLQASTCFNLSRLRAPSLCKIQLFSPMFPTVTRLDPLRLRAPSFSSPRPFTPRVSHLDPSWPFPHRMTALTRFDPSH